MKTYSSEEMISFGEYLMKLSNQVIKKNTNLEPLDSKTGSKLVNDLFEKWKNENCL